MDELKYAVCSQQIQAPNPSSNPQPPGAASGGPPQPGSSKITHVGDDITARKLQKADREKMRRNRLNEQFAELGNVLDPERPKNDKATILADTVQLLKDLTAEVTKLKAEHETLTEESRELTQEKNDLREEKVSLRSDIDSLNAHYQQRLGAKFPWPTMDQSVMMPSPSYPFPMPMAMPTGPVPMHPSMQLFPFYGNQIPGVLPDPCSSFVPYMTPTPFGEPHSSQYISPVQPRNKSHVSGKQDSGNKSSGESETEKSADSNDVRIDLELKTPGSTADQDTSSVKRKSIKFLKKDNNVRERSSSSGCSSPRSVQDSSSNSIVARSQAESEKTGGKK